MDPQQRYCVNCAARRGNGANPSSRYFAMMSKRARRPAKPAAKPRPTNRAAAVGFFALLPIAVALGVVVGRSATGSGDEEALLQALRNQGVAASTAGAAPGAAAQKKARGSAAAQKGGGKVVARTSNGTVHQIAGFNPSKKKVDEDTKLVQNNVDQAGENYIKAQQNLPDVIVVGGDPNSAPALPTGKGQP
jgi:hypothetical protein